MGRNFGVNLEAKSLVCYDDVDMRQAYNHGFWQGSVLTLIGSCVIVGGMLYFIGLFG